MKLKHLFPVAIALLATPAFAHPGHFESANFAEGWAHPLIGLDHTIFMIAIGLWAANYQNRKAFVLPFGFVGGMIIGMLLAYLGYSLPFTESVIALSVIFGGLALALKDRIPSLAAAGFALLVGTFHGHAHGAEATHLTIGFMAGALISTAIMHLFGALIGLKFAQIRKATPILGGIMALLGAFMFAS